MRISADQAAKSLLLEDIRRCQLQDLKWFDRQHSPRTDALVCAARLAEQVHCFELATEPVTQVAFWLEHVPTAPKEWTVRFRWEAS